MNVFTIKKLLKFKVMDMPMTDNLPNVYESKHLIVPHKNIKILRAK